ncbi:probable serine/threonine-protein kinase yakA [Saccostrea echinata]|uniref:probable serine/threonine-protein kinase yakA n=1 Tax=Saccostrea echinata TaxID=191078 RepID=UPI002A817159|nr:probable serine/threonine-protein kinase yakA [Saccostrea echinata]
MKNGTVEMSSKFHSKNIRHSDKLVHLNPPQIHFSAYVTGGLKKLFTKINSHDASVLPLYEYGRFTDIHGHFVPEKNTLLASRYRVLSKVSSRTRGQSSVQIFAKDEFNSDSLVVIKILHKSWGHLAYQEIHFLWSLKVADPYKASRVVQLLNFFELDDHFCLVFEPLIPEPLTRIFQGFHKDQLIPSIKKVTLRLLTTLGFLQQQNVIHADLKPENILLKSDSDVSSVTVIDFGNAIHNNFKEVALYFKDFELQTLLYRAPEVLFGIPFGTEIDLWSLGCILAELYSGAPLFPGTSKIPIIKEMTRLLGPFPRDVFQKGKFYDDLKGYTNVCEQKNASDVLFKKLGCQDYLFRDFLSGLLRYNPADRLAPLKAAQHPFLASELPIAFLLPSTQTLPVINSCPRKGPLLDSDPLEIDQLKPNLLQKVQIIKPLENEDFKTEEIKMGSSFRPNLQKSVSPRGSKRYHSLPDVDRKSNTDLKVQRHVKMSPFHFLSEKKSSPKVSPKGHASQTHQKHSILDKYCKSSEKTKRGHSKSLDEVEQISKDVTQWDEESSSSNDRRLKSLMQEIYEVQAMVEKDLDQRSRGSTDSLELKRRRISDSQISTQKKPGFPSSRIEKERVDTDINTEIDNKECSLPRNCRKAEDDHCSSQSSLSKSSWPYEMCDSVASRKLQSRTRSCGAVEQNMEVCFRKSNVCSNSRRFQIGASPSLSGLGRIQSSKITSTSLNSSTDQSGMQHLPSETLNMRNLQQAWEEKGMDVTEKERFGKSQSKVHSKGGMKQRDIIPNPQNEVSNSEEQERDWEMCSHQEHLTEGNDVPGISSPGYRRIKADNKSRDWSDFYQVKDRVKANHPENLAKSKRSWSTSFETNVNIDRGERNVHTCAASPTKKLQSVGSKAVPRKRLMFSNALHMKKKKRSESTKGARQEGYFVSEPSLQRKEVIRTGLKDPFHFSDTKLSHGLKNGRPSVVKDLETFECDLPGTSNVPWEHEEDMLRHTNNQESFSMTKPKKLNKRPKFSLD